MHPYICRFAHELCNGLKNIFNIRSFGLVYWLMKPWLAIEKLVNTVLHKFASKILRRGFTILWDALVYSRRVRIICPMIKHKIAKFNNEWVKVFERLIRWWTVDQCGRILMVFIILCAMVGYRLHSVVPTEINEKKSIMIYTSSTSVTCSMHGTWKKRS